MYFHFISRDHAISLGHKSYFNGAACSRGGVWLRRCSNRACMCPACKDAENKKSSEWLSLNKERKSSARKKWVEINKDKVNEINSRHRAKNQPAISARAKELNAQNPGRVARYAAEYRERYPEKIKVARKAFRARNSEKIKAAHAAWYEANKESQTLKRQENKLERRAYGAEWRRKNRAKYNLSRARRKAAKIQRTPSWLTSDDYAAIELIYDQAAKMSAEYGESYHVDHIIPLRGKLVSGLHVPINLQILSAHENIKKGNSYVC
jgi:hypothetical protein